MARIRLEIEEMPLRLTLKVMLQGDGHTLTDSESPADICIADSAHRAITATERGPVLLLASHANLGDAVQAMRKGVFGYITIPLVPGEASLMVQRALGSAPKRDEAPDAVLLEDIERAHIETVLRRCKHNQAEAARLLGIGRNTLWRKLKQYSASEHSANSA